MTEIRPDYVICGVERLPRWGRLSANGAKLMVYDVRNAKRAMELSHRGAEFVETFAIAEMLAQLDMLKGIN